MRCAVCVCVCVHRVAKSENAFRVSQKPFWIHFGHLDTEDVDFDGFVDED